MRPVCVIALLLLFVPAVASPVDLNVMAANLGVNANPVTLDHVAAALPESKHKTIGTRTELLNENFLSDLRRVHAQSEYTTSVCTGSALLAKAGIDMALGLAAKVARSPLGGGTQKMGTYRFAVE